MALGEIFCQDRAVSLLQRAFARGMVPHAYIFGGAEGVGKFTTAVEWGKLLLCKDPSGEKGGGDSCGACESCRAFEAEAHPDFNIIYKELIQYTKDGKNKKTPVDLPIDVIREFLIEKVSMRPTLSSRKVFIVKEAERLNRHSQNSLLKILEEPPEYCCIILLCTRLESLLATTKSRCQIVRFGGVDEDVISGKLKEMGVGQDQGRYFGRLARGSLGLACGWGRLELNDANLYRTKRALVDSVVGCEFSDVVELAAEFLDKSRQLAGVWTTLEKDTSKTDINRRAAKTVFGIIISALYDAMKLNVTPETPLINFDQKGQIERLARQFDAEQLAEKIADCYRVLRWIESGVNEKLIFEQLLFNLTGSDRMCV